MKTETKLRIRNMVCGRCVETVRLELSQLGLEVSDVQLGSATVQGSLTERQMKAIGEGLERHGFSLLTDRRASIISRVKEIVQQTLNRDDLGDSKLRFSDLIQDAFSLDYDTISTLFSQTEGLTLEKYIIEKRLDKVKELLVYTDLPLAEIAYRTGFSSVPHLSNQFKQHTSLAPSFFRKVRQEKQAVQQHTHPTT